MREIIQGLWVGSRLSVMEQLSIRSFLRNGHAFHLYVYEHAEGVPAGVVVKDGNEILPRSMLFTYPEYKTYAGFANFFRYKLLLENGGWFVDLDTVCLKPFPSGSEYVFSSELLPNGIRQVNLAALKVPSRSPVMQYAWQQCQAMDITKLTWGQAGPSLITRAVEAFSLHAHVRAPRVFCPVDFQQWERFLSPDASQGFSADTLAVHLWNEMWRRSGRDKDAAYDPRCLYEGLKRRYLCSRLTRGLTQTMQASRSAAAWLWQRSVWSLRPCVDSTPARPSAVETRPVHSHAGGSTISALILTKNGVGRIEACLESIARSKVADETVVCVDRATTDRTFEVARCFTPNVQFVRTQGYFESGLPEAASLCRGDWILRIDDDECLKGDWSREKLEPLLKSDVTHFWIPRRWLVPPGDMFIADQPWFPDVQLRLFRSVRDGITWPAHVHDPVHVKGKSLTLLDRWIDHRILVTSNRAERERKCKEYQVLRPEKHLSHYYLYEEQDLQFLPADAEGFRSALEQTFLGHLTPAIKPADSYRLGAEIRFVSGGNGGQYTLCGWSYPEPWGTWTDGHRAALCIPLTEPVRGPVCLIAETNAFLRPNDRVLQVRVRCGTQDVGEWLVKTPRFVKRSLRLPVAVLAGRKHLILEFEIVNPASPAECGESKDVRLLGLGLRRLVLQGTAGRGLPGTAGILKVV